MPTPATSTWPEIAAGKLSQADFRRRFYPDETFAQAMEKSGAYPTELKTKRPSAAPLKQYARVLRTFGVAWSPTQSKAEAIPIPLGNVGPVLFLAHYDPAVAVPFAKELAQIVVVSIADYLDLHQAFSGLLDYIGAQVENLAAPAGPVPAFAKLSGEPAELSALRWVMDLGLVGTADLGAVRSVISERPFNPARLSSDYQLAVAKIAHGRRIGSNDISRNGGIALSSITQANLDRYKFLPFCEDPKILYFFSPLTEEPGLADFLFSKIQKKTVRITVTKEHLTLLSQAEASHRTLTAVGESRVDPSATKAEVLDPGQLVNFDPTNNENNVDTVKKILFDAASRGASDVHIEVYMTEMRVRISIDNTGIVSLQLPQSRIKGVSAVLKGWSRINLDGNVHAEGRFSFVIGPRLIDTRVSLLIDGSGNPKWTLRLLDKSVGVKSTSQLGLSDSDLRELRNAYRRRHGIMLVSGPTGHGKSTTLYACLNDLCNTERFLYTLEDPIEYTMAGITQIEATSNEEKIAAGMLSFHEGITRLLRAQPHVILVGEMRDAATAQAGVEASMTGHLVLSTTHANDACALVDRMIDLKAEPRLFSESLVMASSQRLLRRLCPSCHGFDPIPKEVRAAYDRNGVTPPLYIHTPRGCEQCNHTGFRGRIVVMEFLPLTSRVREAIAEKAGAAKIREAARQDGFQTMFERGLVLVGEGATSYDEMASVCVEHPYSRPPRPAVKSEAA